jgi:hypothetical protein
MADDYPLPDHITLLQLEHATRELADALAEHRAPNSTHTTAESSRRRVAHAIEGVRLVLPPAEAD